MRAYDLAVLRRGADRADPDCQGWCFGLPPGIEPERWPLDPANGYPLQHGFTLLLPPDYRCHGPGLVAVSFFASAFDLNDGGPNVEAPEIAAAMGAAQAPDDPDLLPFHRAERMAHPHLHRMKDDLGIAYAAILLTEPEFAGPPCRPPRLAGNPYRDRIAPPQRMAVGSAAAYWAVYFASSGEPSGAGHDVLRMLGGVPDEDVCWNRALRWTPRACDPNAGKAPWNRRRGDPPTGYENPYRVVPGEGRSLHGWAEDHADNHIGGTMRPWQGEPRFSPFYVEFEEHLGGYNFGGGNARFDIRDMKFGWACG